MQTSTNNLTQQALLDQFSASSHPPVIRPASSNGLLTECKRITLLSSRLQTADCPARLKTKTVLNYLLTALKSGNNQWYAPASETLAHFYQAVPKLRDTVYQALLGFFNLAYGKSYRNFYLICDQTKRHPALIALAKVALLDKTRRQAIAKQINSTYPLIHKHQIFDNSDETRFFLNFVAKMLTDRDLKNLHGDFFATLRQLMKSQNRSLRAKILEIVGPLTSHNHLEKEVLNLINLALQDYNDHFHQIQASFSLAKCVSHGSRAIKGQAYHMLIEYYECAAMHKLTMHTTSFCPLIDIILETPAPDGYYARQAFEWLVAPYQQEQQSLDKFEVAMQLLMLANYLPEDNFGHKHNATRALHYFVTELISGRTIAANRWQILTKEYLPRTLDILVNIEGCPIASFDLKALKAMLPAHQQVKLGLKDSADIIVRDIPKLHFLSGEVDKALGFSPFCTQSPTPR